MLPPFDCYERSRCQTISARGKIPANPLRTQWVGGSLSISPHDRALREARRLGHAHLGPEHLLLALLRDETGEACATLRAIGAAPGDLERCLGKVLRDAPFARD